MSDDVLYRHVRQILFKSDAEVAHERLFGLLSWAPKSLLRALYPCVYAPKNICGLPFRNAVGLAAGLDKDGRHASILAALGFGFIEIGTVTLKPQEGNPKPRMFRIPEARAIVNRMGFNNHGLDALKRILDKQDHPCVLGINLGKNKDTPLDDAAQDYETLLSGLAAYADYFTINISSPNTPGLRALQYGEHLEKLLDRIKQVQVAMSARYVKPLPLFVKVAPDLTDIEIQSMVQTFQKYQINGVIATNTTLDKTAVTTLPYGQEEGGLSGAPLKTRANHVLQTFRHYGGKQFAYIGVGGILSPDDAIEKITCGADLVQLYTGLVYQGPRLIGDIARRLKNHVS